jgi:uncharacterized membrane protein YraQ (UPF0718 family)
MKGYLGNSVLAAKMQVTGENKVSAPGIYKLDAVKSKDDLIVSCCAVMPGSENLKSVNSCGCSTTGLETNLQKRILVESWKSFSMVMKFMSIAFLINALIKFYIPDDLIMGFFGTSNAWTVVIATLIGIPFYTTNMTALPIVSGLISLGMNEGAALAFLIAGPLTTLPAMMAVWGIVNRKVFLAYVLFGLVGSIFFGYLYNLFLIIK